MTETSGTGAAGTLSLSVSKGPDAGKTFALETNRDYVLGRADDCDIRIDPADKMVSRKHVRLKVKGGTTNITLENLSKTNPVQVKGKPVTSTVLKPGDKFQVGETVFVLNAPGGAPASASGGPDKKVLLLIVIIIAILALLVFIFAGGRDDNGQPAPVSGPASDYSDLSAPAVTDGGTTLPPVSGMAVSEKDREAADEHFRKGLFFYDTGNILKAVNEWERALSFNPDHADARTWFLKAERELAEAVKAHYQSAVLHYKYMRYDQAAYEFKMVVELSRNKNSDQYINALRYLDELRNR